jgi:uncharacterized protein YbjT (DUF2867 family)
LARTCDGSRSLLGRNPGSVGQPTAADNLAPHRWPHIIRATQFLEFLGGIADSSADRNIVRLPPCLFQPIAADDVAPVVAEVALAAPRRGIVEIAGPERAPFNEIVSR